MTTEWPTNGLDVDALARHGWHPVPFQQFVLKIHGRCNLACDYCYMYRMADRSWSAKPRMMSPVTVRQTCHRIAEHATRHRLARVEVVLHGGEPLLAGPAVLADIATRLRRELPSGTALDLQIQTNGILLDQATLNVLLAHRIRVGVSLDGGPEAHDKHRRYLDGRGSHAHMARGLRLMSNEPYRRLFAGLLCVINLDEHPEVIYESLLAFDPPRVDFLLPHGNWSIPPPRRPADAGETPYGDWLIRLFERWYGVSEQETEVRLFTEIINLVLGGQSRTESVGLSPVALITVNTDGSIEQVDTLRSAYPGAATTGLNVTDNSSTTPCATRRSSPGSSVWPRSPTPAAAAKSTKSAVAATTPTASATAPASATPRSTAPT